jgi:serine/threonine-protein kinase/endoribonuclease IRE1
MIIGLSSSEREYNIEKGTMNLGYLNHMPEARDLVGAMTCHNPANRITASDAAVHPMFWDDETKLSFILDVSDRVETDGDDSELRRTLESRAPTVVGMQWDNRVDQTLLDNLRKYRKYDFSSVRDCLRVIRYTPTLLCFGLR